MAKQKRHTHKFFRLDTFLDISTNKMKLEAFCECGATSDIPDDLVNAFKETMNVQWVDAYNCGYQMGYAEGNSGD